MDQKTGIFTQWDTTQQKERRRKKELLPLLIAWVDLENIMPSEISQAVKDKYHMISANEQNKQMSKIEPEAWKEGTD